MLATVALLVGLLAAGDAFVRPAPRLLPLSPGEALITSRSLVFSQGTGTLDVRMAAPEVDWMVRRPDRGTPVLQGRAVAAGGTGHIPLASLEPGYYAVTLIGAAPDEQSETPFVVLPAQDAGGAPIAAAGSRFGIGIHALDDENIAQLGVLRQIGLTHVRFDLEWNQVEQVAGVYDFDSYYGRLRTALQAAGVVILPVAAYRNPLYDNGRSPSSAAGRAAFARYAAAAAAYFRGSANGIEIFNEPNLVGFSDGACGTTPQCYLPLLQASSARVRAQVPGVPVVGPSAFASDNAWISRLLGLGAAPALDVLSLHPYRYPSAPDTLGSQLADLADVLAQRGGDRSIPVWITEMGWPTGSSVGVSESDQADDLIQSQTIALASGVERLYWYELIDSGTDPDDKEDHFGLLRAPTAPGNAPRPKPALAAQATVVAQIGERPSSGGGQDGPVTSYQFGSGADAVRVLWSSGLTAVDVVGNSALSAVDRFGSGLGGASSGRSMRLQLSNHPVIVHGDIRSVIVQ